MANDIDIEKIVTEAFQTFNKKFEEVKQKLERDPIKLNLQFQDQVIKQSMDNIARSIDELTKHVTGFGTAGKSAASAMDKDFGKLSTAIGKIRTDMLGAFDGVADLDKVLNIAGIDKQMGHFIASVNSGKELFEKIAQQAGVVKDSIGGEAAKKFAEGSQEYQSAAASFFKGVKEAQAKTQDSASGSLAKASDSIRNMRDQMKGLFGNIPDIEKILGLPQIEKELQRLLAISDNIEHVFEGIAQYGKDLGTAEGAAGAVAAGQVLSKAKLGQVGGQEAKSFVETAKQHLKPDEAPSAKIGAMFDKVSTDFSRGSNHAAKSITMGLSDAFGAGKKFVGNFGDQTKATIGDLHEFGSTLVSLSLRAAGALSNYADIVNQTKRNMIELDKADGSRILSISKVIDNEKGLQDVLRANTEGHQMLRSNTIATARALGMTTEQFLEYGRKAQKAGVLVQGSGELINGANTKQIEELALMGKELGLTSDQVAGLTGKFQGLEGPGSDLQKNFAYLAAGAKFARMDISEFSNLVGNVTADLEGFGVNVEDVAKGQAQQLEHLRDLGFSAEGAKKHLNDLQNAGKKSTAAQLAFQLEMLKQSDKWPEIKKHIADKLGKRVDELSYGDEMGGLGIVERTEPTYQVGGQGLSEIYTAEAAKRLQTGGGAGVDFLVQRSVAPMLNANPDEMELATLRQHGIVDTSKFKSPDDRLKNAGATMDADAKSVQKSLKLLADENAWQSKERANSNRALMSAADREKSVREEMANRMMNAGELNAIAGVQQGLEDLQIALAKAAGNISGLAPGFLTYGSMIVGALGTLGMGLAKLHMSGLVDVTSKIGKLANPVGRFAGRVGRGLKSAPGRILGSLGRAGRFVKSAGEGILGRAGTLGRGLVSGAGRVGGSLISGAGTVFEGLTSAAGTATKSLLGLVRSVPTTGLAATFEGLMGLPALAAESFTGILPMIGAAFTAGWPIILGGIAIAGTAYMASKIMPSLGTDIQNIGRKLSDGFVEMFPSLSKNAKDAWDKMWSSMDHLFNGEFGAAADDLAGMLKSSAKSILGGFEDIVYSITGIDIAPYIEDAGAFIGDMLTTFGDNLKEIIPAIGNALASLKDTISGAIQTIKDMIPEPIKNAANKVKDFVYSVSGKKASDEREQQVMEEFKKKIAARGLVLQKQGGLSSKEAMAKAMEEKSNDLQENIKWRLGYGDARTEQKLAEFKKTIMEPYDKDYKPPEHNKPKAGQTPSNKPETQNASSEFTKQMKELGMTGQQLKDLSDEARSRNVSIEQLASEKLSRREDVEIDVSKLGAIAPPMQSKDLAQAASATGNVFLTLNPDMRLKLESSTNDISGITNEVMKHLRPVLTDALRQVISERENQRNVAQNTSGN